MRPPHLESSRSVSPIHQPFHHSTIGLSPSTAGPSPAQPGWLWPSLKGQPSQCPGLSRPRMKPAPVSRHVSLPHREVEWGENTRMTCSPCDILHVGEGGEKEGQGAGHTREW
jgi:hypothetical protein